MKILVRPLAFFGAVVFVTRGRGMGLGDVKLAGAIGLFLGMPDAFFSFLAAFVTGALTGLVLIARGRSTLKGHVPFGPFLIFGVFLTVFVGGTIVRSYFSFFEWVYGG